MCRLWRLIRNHGQVRLFSHGASKRLKGRVTVNPINPMQQPAHLAEAPRCGAKTRAGTPCRSPAVKGKRRCRMHGGMNKGAPAKNRNAWKHGNRSGEAEEQLKLIHQTDRILKAVSRARQLRPLSPSDQDVLQKLTRHEAGLSSEGES